MSTSIYLYKDRIGCVDYVQHMGSDLTIVNSARVSFGVESESLTEKDIKLIHYLAKHKHTSTFEHNVVTFRFTVPLFVRSQHHRHRTWSYNEISRRYTSANMRFYEPIMFRTQHKVNRQASEEILINPDLSSSGRGEWPPSQLLASDALMGHNKRSLDLYNLLLQNGICREQARAVLPQSLYTEYYGTVNLNNLLKFVALRSHEGAQWEIQQVAHACLEIAADLWPNAVSAYTLGKD